MALPPNSDTKSVTGQVTELDSSTDIMLPHLQEDLLCCCPLLGSSLLITTPNPFLCLTQNKPAVAVAVAVAVFRPIVDDATFMLFDCDRSVILRMLWYTLYTVLPTKSPSPSPPPFIHYSPGHLGSDAFISSEAVTHGAGISLPAKEHSTGVTMELLLYSMNAILH